ncbi:putative MFS monosaccharide transporter [Plectosphaerella plurivora]|uniref:MFS monosaccharide transporter n=1 Tax=Plectosphaerella plurivora TaxID=936078 RepID=A0A9P9A8E7_9PEZI|nr:putative MFS monosaccharide transporter [Plectosphaerella plurivora]
MSVEQKNVQASEALAGHDEDGHPDKLGDQLMTIADNVIDSHPSGTSMYMMRLYGILSVGYFCIILQGYDSSLMGGINAVPEYLEYFGMKQASSGTGLVFAMYNIGCVSALPFAGPVNDHFGRRWGMFTGAFLVIAATCIMAPATNMNMFLAGRWMVGFGQGFLNVAGITYVTEMAHPYFRGPAGAFLQTNYFVGSMIASWVTYGTAFLSGDITWRLPTWLQMASSIYICIGVFFIPDTPRWLMAQDRQDAAEAVLVKYHGEGSRENPWVALQLAEMRAQISQDGTDKRWWDYSGMFKTAPARRRLLCVVAFSWFGQYSGNALVSYYFPVIVQQTGIKDAKTQLLLNALNPVFSWVAAVVGSMLADRAGRRPLLLAGFAGCALSLSVVTGLSRSSTVDGNVPAGHAGIAFIYIFAIIFAFCITPLQPFYISEVLDTENRAKGNATGQLVAGIAGIVGQYTTGVAIGAIGYYYYLVFIFWDVFEVIIVYFFFPETKNRTLEEINEIFEDPKPVQKSLEKRTQETVLNAMLRT